MAALEIVVLIFVLAAGSFLCEPEPFQQAWSAFLQMSGVLMEGQGDGSASLPTPLDWLDWPVCVGWVAMVATYWVVGLSFLVVDLVHRPALVYNTKIQPASPLLPEGGARNPPLWAALVELVLCQCFVVLPGLQLISFVARALGAGLEVSAQLPSLAHCALHIFLAAAATEVLFYYSHRLLHAPALYARVHKEHHRWRTPIALAALHAHPLEVFLGNTLSLMAAPFFLRTHFLVWLLSVCVGMVGTQLHHCGYKVTPHADIQPNFHDWHHEKFNECFGLFGWLDWLHGTDAAFRQRAAARDALRK
mmetsp:Transcript_23702/g.59322  ORF Transcript_23702/g.59322 Transcript_23702/m.59322 type:complete len:305 (+) Transcript_23702:425-1339(+)